MEFNNVSLVRRIKGHVCKVLCTLFVAKQWHFVCVCVGGCSDLSPRGEKQGKEMPRLAQGMVYLKG